MCNSIALVMKFGFTTVGKNINHVQDVSYTHFSQLHIGTKHYDSVHVFLVNNHEGTSTTTSSVATTTKNGKAMRLHIKSAAYLNVKVN